MTPWTRKTLIVVLFCCTPLTIANVSAAAEPARPVPIIFDTDIGNDIDDALALGVNHALVSRGECRLAAVTISKDNPLCAPFIDLVNTFYGRGVIPIGVVRDGKTTDDGKYLRAPVEARDGDAVRFPHDLASGVDAPEAVDVFAAGFGGRGRSFGRHGGRWLLDQYRALARFRS